MIYYLGVAVCIYFGFYIVLGVLGFLGAAYSEAWDESAALNEKRNEKLKEVFSNLTIRSSILSLFLWVMIPGSVYLCYELVKYFSN